MCAGRVGRHGHLPWRSTGTGTGLARHATMIRTDHSRLDRPMPQVISDDVDAFATTDHVDGGSRRALARSRGLVVRGTTHDLRGAARRNWPRRQGSEAAGVGYGYHVCLWLGNSAEHGSSDGSTLQHAPVTPAGLRSTSWRNPTDCSGRSLRLCRSGTPPSGLGHRAARRRPPRHSVQ
jgi:hypothetical protein